MPQNEREPTADSAKAVPEFGGRRLLLVSSGAVAVMHLPFWLNWISTNYPDLQIQAVVTPSAQRFVSQDALTLLTGRRAHLDRWPAQTDTGALHAQWVEWADCALVYPATLNYLGRLASGLGDSPSLLALQCAATIPIVVAPSLPPRCHRQSNRAGEPATAGHPAEPRGRTHAAGPERDHRPARRRGRGAGLVSDRPP